MSDSLQRAPVGVRVTAKQGERVAVYARSRRAVFGKRWSFDLAVPELTWAKLLRGALARDVLHPGIVSAEGGPADADFSHQAYANTLCRAAGMEAALHISP